MMHHPNMHHQPMSGHPPQHMPGHQAMPGPHQMPPHQMHRENRHVTLTRVPLGPTAGGGLSAHGHGQAMGGMGVPPPHHAPAQRPPHPIRPMQHHPPAQHHSVPPQQMKPMRRPYAMSGGYGPGSGPSVMPPPYAQPPPMQPHPTTQPPQTGLCSSLSPVISTQTKLSSDFAVSTSSHSTSNPTATSPAPAPAVDSGTGGQSADTGAASDGDKAAGDSEAVRPAAAQANSKEKTPMCLVNELARYNKIKHQYRLTSETGPAHKKVFTVTLRLGDTEEYTAEGSSIKRAQHAAASAALAATGFPPPPSRATPAHAPTHPHHRHSGAVMPTVELNALAMKLCQPAVYTSIPPVAAPPRMPRARPAVPYRMPFVPPYQRMLSPGLVYRVRVCVGGRAWLGEGSTPQAARHDAAARALHDLRPPPDRAPPVPPAATDTDTGDATSDILNSEVKSPVSLVHELALKRNLTVQFTVKCERGPPHMRVFVTACTVGELETEGEGNGKKVSKRRAAERMLDEMRCRWPPAVLRCHRPPPGLDKRRHQTAKKKPRNLIKEGGVSSADSGASADNPISRLAVARHAVRARSPQYRVLEERGAARRREFLVQCDAPPHCATGLGPNKKTAKRRAAHNVLLAMEMSAKSTEGVTTNGTSNPEPNNTSTPPESGKTTSGNETKRKDGESPVTGGANNEVRQPVPGVLMMDYHQRTGQPSQPNGVSESSATGGTGGNTPGAKDQLMYLSQLLGFTVQFSDFPKRNHGEYLSLVSLSTEPPVMCHGGGPSTAHSHEQCSRAALRALALMGLDAAPPTPTIQSMPVAGSKSGVMSNGISE